MRYKAVMASVAMLFIAGHALAGVDQEQARQLEKRKLPQRWDNVESIPSWLTGKKPWFNPAVGSSQVTLKPGERSSVKIPAGETLMMYRNKEKWRQADVTVYISNGSGLLVQRKGRISDNGHSLYIDHPFYRPYIVTIKRPEHFDSKLKTALFISRTKRLEEIIRYRDVLPLDAPKVSIKKSSESSAVTYWKLSGNKPVQLKISGPVRIKLETRLIKPAMESALDQAYILDTLMDSTPLKTFYHYTGTEYRFALFTKGKPEVMGWRQADYFEVPEGDHTVTIASSSDVYARIFSLHGSDYLVSILNDPADDNDDDDSNDDDNDNRRAEGYESVWHTPNPAGPAPATPRGKTESDRCDFSARLSIDNSVREGGIHSVSALDEMTRIRQDYSPVGVSARRTLGQRSFYRDLVPDAGVVGQAQYYLFNTPRLLYKNETRQNAYVPQRAIRNLLKRVGGALFVHLRAGEQNRLTYPLPERKAPSRLRVAIPADTGADDVFIRFDDAKPIHIKLAPAMRVAPDQLAVTQGASALSALSAIHDKVTVNTLSGPANSYGVSAPMITAGFAEVEIPAEAKIVRVWRLGAKWSASHGFATIALQYRASKPYLLDESFYRVMLDRLANTPEERFSSAMKLLNNEEAKPAKPETDKDYARIEISNYYAPLQRRLSTARRIFMASVAMPKEDIKRDVAPGAAEKLADRARRAAMENQWLVALESWSRVRGAIDIDQRRTAQMEMANALYNLGERFMAENLLRGYYLFSKDETLRYQAFKALEDRYTDEKDVEKLVNLYATDIEQEVDPHSATALVSALAKNREHLFAVMIGAAMPEGLAPKDELAKAAFIEGWQRLFKKTVDSMDDGPLKNRWLGHELAMKGEYAEAVKAWRRAEYDGIRLANLLERGLALERGLTSKNREERVETTRRWSRLAQSHPGPYVWKPARNMVAGYAGANIIYNINRDAFFRMFRAVPGNPLKLKILGPARIKIEARPLHSPNSKRPINGWILVKSKGALDVTPVNNNWPSGGLEIIGSHDKPGAKVETIYDVGPGIHEITVLREHGPALFRVFASEPELPIPTVPPWNLQTVSQVISGKYIKTTPKGKRIDKTDIFETSGGVQLEKTKISPQTIKEMAELFPPQGNGDKAERLLAKHDFKSVISEPVGQSREDIQNKMARLAYVGEHDQALRDTAISRAQGLYASHPDVPGALGLLRRLTHDMAWVKAGAVTSGAGLARVRLTGWAPQSASMRVRKALMWRMGNDEAIVTGYNSLKLALRNPKPAIFQLTFRLADIAYIPTAPVTVLYRAGAADFKRLSLSVDEPLKSILLSTPTGRGDISVRIENPLVNQFIRVKIYELASDAHGRQIRKPVAMDSVKTYYIAAPGAPVTAVVTGPASVRINELRDGQTWTRVIRFGAGIHNVKLKPAPGAKKALFRVSVQEKAPGKRHSALRQIVAKAKPVPWPNFTFNGELVPAKIEKAPSGSGQEDGTWSAMALYERRRSVQEDVDKLFTPEKFTEFRIGHDFANLPRTFHTHTHIFWRDREKGEGTAGLTQKFYYRANGSQLGWSLAGIGYTQKPKNQLPREWSAYLKSAMSLRWELGPKWENTPRLAIYYRYLTANGVATADVGYVDQDIFTSYKSQHKYGVIASDTLKYRPWMDTILGVSVIATSNEDFAIYQPDHVSVKVFGKQLLWPFQLGVGYRVTRYFSDTARQLEVDRRWLSARLTISQWISRNTLLKAGVMELRDMDRNDDTWYVFASFGFGHARGYRDAFPGSVSFADVKKFKIPQP